MIPLPLAQSDISLLRSVLVAVPSYPNLTEAQKAEFAALPVDTIASLQRLSAENFAFLSSPNFSQYQKLYNMIWDTMQREASEVLKKLASLPKIAATQSLALSHRIYDGHLIGRRSDLDLLCAVETADEAQSMLESYGYADISITEDGEVKPTEEAERLTGVPFDKRYTMSKLVPFYPPDTLQDFLPDVLLPLIATQEGYRLYFGIQLTVSYRHGLDWSKQSKRIAPGVPGVCFGLAQPSDALLAVIGLLRVETAIRRANGLKITPIYDVVALLSRPDFEITAIEEITVESGLHWIPPEAEALIAMSQDRHLSHDGPITRHLGGLKSSLKPSEL
jgi:hypothetical protein